MIADFQSPFLEQSFNGCFLQDRVECMDKKSAQSNIYIYGETKVKIAKIALKKFRFPEYKECEQTKKNNFQKLK